MSTERLDIHTLWIGDRLINKQNKTVGTFEGLTADEKIIFKTTSGAIMELDSDALVYLGDEVYTPDLTWEDESPHQKVVVDQLQFDDVIDLHYDRLIQFRTHEYGHILDFQLAICKEFIEHALETKKTHVRIIYGKGAGVLKNAVDLLLKKYTQISIASAHPDQASTDVWFK